MYVGSGAEAPITPTPCTWLSAGAREKTLGGDAMTGCFGVIRDSQNFLHVGNANDLVPLTRDGRGSLPRPPLRGRGSAMATARRSPAARSRSTYEADHAIRRGGDRLPGRTLRREDGSENGREECRGRSVHGRAIRWGVCRRRYSVGCALDQGQDPGTVVTRISRSVKDSAPPPRTRSTVDQAPQSFRIRQTDRAFRPSRTSVPG